MAGSRRKLIRETFRQFLVGKTDAGDAVFTNTASASWSEQLPLIAIYTRSEDVELYAIAPREYRRTLQIMVEVITQGEESTQAASTGLSAEDSLDAITDQIERALGPDETLGEIDDEFNSGKKICMVDELLLNGIEFTFRGEGSKPQAAAVMHYTAKYYAYDPGALTEQTGLGMLQKVHVDWETNQPPDKKMGVADDLVIP